MKVAIYARRSEEKDTGESIENQLSICRKYVDLKYGKCIIDKYHDDDFSGKNTNRPDYEKMMRLIRSGNYGCLVFWKLDRISRNALDFLSLHRELEKINVNMVSVTEGFDPSTASGKLMMTILASVAEMERKNTSMRVTSAMNESAKKGRWSGGNPPFGYKSIRLIENGIEVPYLIEDEKNFDIAKDIFSKYLSSTSFHATSRMLKEKYDIAKSPSDIRKMMLNPAYIISTIFIKNWFKKNGVMIYGDINGNGLISYGKEDFTSEDGDRKKRDKKEWIIAVGKHKGIISDLEFIKIHDIIQNNKRGRSGTGDSTFLNPLVHCALCGSYMRIRTMHNKSGIYKYFVCMKKDVDSKACSSKMVKVNIIEEKTLEKLEYISLNKNQFLNDFEQKDNTPGINIFKKESEKLNKQIKNLIKKSALNEDLEDIFLDEIRELKIKLLEINPKLSALENEQILNLNANINVDSVFSDLGNIRNLINSCIDIESKRETIRLYIKRIDVDSIDKKINIQLCL